MMGLAFNKVCAIKIVCDAVQKEITTLSPNQKFVLIMGEEHTTSSHTLLQETVIQTLSQSQTAKNFITVALELDNRTNLADIADGSVLFSQTPKAQKRLCNLLEKEGIYALFNDAQAISSHKESYLIPQDTLAATLAWNKYDLNLSSDFINIQSSEGMDIRNQVMVKRATMALEQERHDTLIQICGDTHAHGSRQHSYQHTLTKYYKDAGYKVLTVHTPTMLCHILPKDIDNKSFKENQNTIIFENISSKRFMHHETMYDDHLLEEEDQYIQLFTFK